MPVFDLNAFIRARMTLPQLDLLAQIRLDILNIKIPDINIKIPSIELDLSKILPIINKFKEIFDFVNNYVIALEVEVTGLSGTKYYEITDTDLEGFASGKHQFYFEYLSTGGDFTKLASFPAFPKINGTALPVGEPNNERDGIDDYFAGTTPEQKNAAIAKMLAGLNVQKHKLEFLRDTYGVDVSEPLDGPLGVNAAIANASLGFLGIDETFLVNRKNYIDTVRLPANNAERTVRYQERMTWLTMLASQFMGVMSKKIQLEHAKAMLQETKNGLQKVADGLGAVLGVS
jgi:hypothetical protein